MPRQLILPIAAALTLAAAPGLTSAQSATQFSGKLTPTLVELPGISPQPFRILDSAWRKSLAITLDTTERAFLGSISFRGTENGKSVVKRSVPLLLIESDSAPLRLYSSLDGDSTFAIHEQQLFTVPATTFRDWKPEDRELWIHVPLPDGNVITSYPVHLMHVPAATETYAKVSKAPMDKMRFLWSSQHVAQGTIDVNGKDVLVQFDVDPLTGGVRETGYISVDCNGDSKIEPRSKVERFYKRSAKDDAIFKVGETYISPVSVDATTGAVTFRQRQASDYVYLHMETGEAMPDFEFADLDGTPRKISDFQGKYLLIDIWGTWCGPCVAEIPHLREAYEQFKGRNFEILGLGKDSDEEKVRAFLAKHNVTWPQASTASEAHGGALLQILEKRLRVTSYPTVVLVGPDGKIVSLNGAKEPKLRGKALLETLDTLLPPAT